MRKLEAKAEAETLFENFGAGRFPVPIVEIANNLGISVFRTQNYPSEKNGHIQLDENDTATIIVNDKHSPERKRFTIAHEIAHFQFDMDYLKQYKSIDRDGDANDTSYRLREVRANEFAANLLMPEKQFVAQWLALLDMEKVADYFAVSKETAKYRAINLGLLTG